MPNTVKAVADLAGVTVRTLHHYDEIGLLKPAEVTGAGYRIYSDEDLERLQQILFFRELGFSLHEIKEIMDSPGFDRRQALLDHRKLLEERQERLGRLIQSVDRTLDSMERGIEMDKKDMFDGFDQSKYEEEARRRWGHTDAYKESMRRTKQYTEADWTAMKEEGRQIQEGVAALMDHGPTDAAVQEWIRRHHKLINDRFYPCSTQMYRGLGDLYVQDERFTATYESVKPGMASFMRSAMHAYCDTLEKKANNR